MFMQSCLARYCEGVLFGRQSVVRLQLKPAAVVRCKLCVKICTQESQICIVMTGRSAKALFVTDQFIVP